MNSNDLLIKNFCFEIESHNKIKYWTDMSDSEIFQEFLICLLGSRVQYEMAITYTKKIMSVIDDLYVFKEFYSLQRIVLNLLSTEAFLQSISKKYKSYRYPNRASINISNAILKISSGEINFRDMFNGQQYSMKNIRRKLIDSFSGIGPKQASHFLKNIGYSNELAILDIHIIKYLKSKKQIESEKINVSSINSYELLEDKFISIIQDFQFPPVVVDQSIWFISRNGGLV